MHLAFPLAPDAPNPSATAGSISNIVPSSVPTLGRTLPTRTTQRTGEVHSPGVQTLAPTLPNDITNEQQRNELHYDQLLHLHDNSRLNRGPPRSASGFQRRVERLRSYVHNWEYLMGQGFYPTPPIAMTLRSQAIALMAEQYNHSDWPLTTQGPIIDDIHTRTQNIYRRTDQRLQEQLARGISYQDAAYPSHYLRNRIGNGSEMDLRTGHVTEEDLRIMQVRVRQHERLRAPDVPMLSGGPNLGSWSEAPIPYYMAVSPDGRELFLAAPNRALVPMVGFRGPGAPPGYNPRPADPVPPITGGGVNPNPNPNADANANANQAVANPRDNQNVVAMENVVRQAVLNQRAGNPQVGMARLIRRGWLFIRLYFFCYMFSEPGTWTRILYVSVAVLFAILSETDIPQQSYRLVVAPIQRHLEGLVNLPASYEANQAGRENAENQNTEDRPAEAQNGGSVLHGARDSLRRAERSLVLFLASLVPGVGERQVEARQAVEAAREAERAREGAQRQEQAEQTAQDENAPAEGDLLGLDDDNEQHQDIHRREEEHDGEEGNHDEDEEEHAATEENYHQRRYE